MKIRLKECVLSVVHGTPPHLSSYSWRLGAYSLPERERGEHVKKWSNCQVYLS
jgi:hypothetical protein